LNSDIAFELFKDSTNQPAPVLERSKVEGTTPAAVAGDSAARKGWYDRIFGGGSLASMKDDKNAPVGIARQNIEALQASERAKLDGYYVRIRYNDKVMTVPGCKAAGKHLDGDDSFCTLVSSTSQIFIYKTNGNQGSL
jgi:acid phosphatase